MGLSSVVTNEPIEVGKSPVEVEDFRKKTEHFRGINRIYLKVMKKTQKVSTCNQLDLETLGYQLFLPKILSR